MNIDILYHARVIADIQFQIKDRGFTTIRLGTEESKALIEANKIVKDTGISNKLKIMLNMGYVMLDANDHHMVNTLKAAMAKAGGQPLKTN